MVLRRDGASYSLSAARDGYLTAYLLEPGEYRLLVISERFAPVLRSIRVRSGENQEQVSLAAGCPMKLIVTANREVEAVWIEVKEAGLGFTLSRSKHIEGALQREFCLAPGVATIRARAQGAWVSEELIPSPTQTAVVRLKLE